jgi:two-component system alkaline phosphatase synthesis response regulator PhoP
MAVFLHFYYTMETKETISERKEVTHPIVLAVDDDADILFLLKAKLTKQGYKVIISQNGRNIIDLIEQSSPQLILMDLSMQGVEGATLCSILKNNASTAHINIILFSGNDNIDAVCERCGADGYLVKPYNQQEFEHELARLGLEV